MPDEETRYNEDLGRRVRDARRRAKLSQAELAEAAGVPRTSMILIERGRQRVHAHMLLRMARELDVHPVELLLGREDADPRPSNLPIPAPPAVRAFVVDVREAARTSRRRTP